MSGNKSVIDAYLTEAKRLNCKPTKNELEFLGDAIKIDGNHFPIWQSAVTEAITIRDRNKKVLGSLSQAVSCYQNLCDKHVQYECPKCEKSGFVQVILLHGEYQGRKKIYIYDPEGINDSFLEKMAAINTPFMGRSEFIPCICKNGDKKNSFFSGDWLSDSNRRKAFERCFMRGKEDTAEYYIDQHLQKIAALGRCENYQIVHHETAYQKLFGRSEAC